MLIYGLIVVGIQANYAAATSPLRFGALAQASPAEPLAAVALPPLSPTIGATTPALPVLTEPLAAPAESSGEALPPPTELAPELRPWRAKLLRLMAEEQPWLEPELTLTELAQRLRTHPALLSKVINAGCGQNFNDFVNSCRVREARRKLADPRFGHYSLVGVALDSGFDSKSTFNRVFKKLLGQAPSAVGRPKS